MREVTGTLWALAPQYDAICITTNGTIKSNGHGVMGRGCALEAARKYPTLPKVLGDAISSLHNHVFLVEYLHPPIFFFPVKHNWYEKADIALIERSAKELIEALPISNVLNVLLPRPGCGNGHLNWEDVKKVIEPILDDRVTIISF